MISSRVFCWESLFQVHLSIIHHIPMFDFCLFFCYISVLHVIFPSYVTSQSCVLHFHLICYICVLYVTYHSCMLHFHLISYISILYVTFPSCMSHFILISYCIISFPYNIYPSILPVLFSIYMLHDLCLLAGYITPCYTLLHLTPSLYVWVLLHIDLFHPASISCSCCLSSWHAPPSYLCCSLVHVHGNQFPVVTVCLVNHTIRCNRQ